jgi:predicted amidohydrolase
MRIAGAQIPCSKVVADNVKTIKKAIDWSVGVGCDFLVTPEGSLSGYLPNYDVEATIKALPEIEKYAKEKGIGLCLGTLWIEDEPFGKTRRNQIRFYDQEGAYLGAANKTHGVRPDETFLMNDIKKDGVKVYTLVSGNPKVGRDHLQAVGLICNDLWPTGVQSIPHIAQRQGVDIMIHSSNGARGDIKRDILYNDWHDAHLRMVCHNAQVPIITVDNCWHMNGEPYDGETSSESGVVIDGRFVTKVPRTGTQYFYWDF